MANGLVDCIVMVKGCGLLMSRLGRRPSKSIFVTGANNDRVFQVVKNWPSPEPCVDTSLLDKSIKTLELVCPLLQGNVNHRFYDCIMNVLISLRRSLTEGYLMFLRIYPLWATMGHEDLRDEVTQILFIHWLTMYVVIQPLLKQISPLGRHSSPQTSLAILQ
jgi:hypothetical protein